MTDAGYLAADPGEPVALWQRAQAPPAAAQDLRCVAFEYTSRGDRVPARLSLPAHGARASRKQRERLGGGGLGPAETDPLRHVGRIAPRPLLFVGATRDQTIPRTATEALFGAAGEPKQLLWFDATHATLPGAALKAMWLFLRAALGLAAPPA